MRKTTLAVVAVLLVAAGIGIGKMLAHVAAKPETVSTGSRGEPAVANIAPLEIMKERGKDLPTSRPVDPF
jgi:hypothetical protein